jgi:cytochrome c oxidase cbb3-type subunit 1
MWVSGIMEGLMWRQYTPQGFLAYSFIETVAAKHVENIVRLGGGLLYFSGILIMTYNLWRTARMPVATLAVAGSPLTPPLRLAGA